MLKSMTGFGRCENATDEYKISVEMKAVNHRYLDLSIKMPKKFNYFEAAIRTLLKKYIQRGKVDLFINYEDYTEGNLCLKYNRILAGEYMEYFRKMEEEFGIRNDIQVSALSRCPEVLTMEQVPMMRSIFGRSFLLHWKRQQKSLLLPERQREII